MLREATRRAALALRAPFWIGVLAVAVWVLIPDGFANYDTFYALVWGDELARGESLDYGAPIPPTPHPLADLAGFALSPLGDDAETAIVAIAYLSLGAIGYLVYRLGQIWFNRAVGVFAAAIVLTREPMLSDAVRAYVDIPYLALLLAALVVESRRPRAGWPVLALLAAAGLLRPEAWLFSAAYLAYLWFERDPIRRFPAFRSRLERSNLELGLLTALAASAPLLWIGFDLATADDPLHSLTGTRETVETLERQTGPVDLVLYGPRRLGEVLREPGLLGAAVGVALSLWLLRARAALLAIAAGLALLAFAVLATAGLAVIPRYLLPAAAILAIFAAAGLLGWTFLEHDHPWRRRWAALAALVLVVFIAFTPKQVGLIEDLHDSIATQDRIKDDLHTLVEEGAFAPGCQPVSVPNHRIVPLLALWLERRPSTIVSSSEQRQPGRGYFLDEASERVARDFTLDPNDPKRLTTEPPGGFGLETESRFWKLYENCS